jgi:Zn-dependent peptidase ImmA (M78 family)
MTWSLPANRYDEIRSAVADLIEDWGISTYPFSIWSLLRKMGIRVIAYSSLPSETRDNLCSKSEDAFTVYPPDFNPNRTVIFYNDEIRDRERIRFTLAHELGHLILMHPDIYDEVYEHEADIFANYFLVPAPLLLEYSEIDYAVVHGDFAVSYSCAASACDRAAKRRDFGPSEHMEYEQRILQSCRLMEGGGRLAPV